MEEFNKNFMEALVAEMLLEPLFIDKLFSTFKECYEKAVKETCEKYEAIMISSMSNNLISSISDPRIKEAAELLNQVLNTLDETTFNDPIRYYRIMNNMDNQLMIVNLYLVQLSLIKENNLTEEGKMDLMKSCIDRMQSSLIDIDFSECIPDCRVKRESTTSFKLCSFDINGLEYIIYITYQHKFILKGDSENKIMIYVNDMYYPINPIDKLLTDGELEAIKNICIEDANKHKE